MRRDQGLSDVDMLQGLRNGDQRVFRQLFDSHYKNMVITAYQILKDDSASKDVAQDVMISIWNNRLKLNQEMHFASYLKRGVINKAINRLKSRRHHTGSGEAPLDFQITKERQPDQLMEDNELKKVVSKAIDDMPERCRQIFVLCRMEQLSHKEIAAQLSISTKTIENQMTRALKIIRKALSEYRSLTIFLFIFYSLWGISAVQLFTTYNHFV